MARPLALACEVRRVDGEWTPRRDELPSYVDPDVLDGLAWEMGMEALLPSRRFRYVGGEACRELLRPLGWPRWEPRSLSDSVRASPLTYPSLDDPRLVLRRRADHGDELKLSVTLELAETLDAAAEARDLGLELRGLAAWLGGVEVEEAAFAYECEGRGHLWWSREHGRPVEIDLAIDAELGVGLDFGLPVGVVAEGTLRQRMTWEAVEECSPPAEGD